MTAVSIFLGLLLFICCLVFPIARSKGVGSLTLLDWSILGIGLIYGLGWAAVIGFTRAGHNVLWESMLLPFEHHFLVLNILACVLAFTIVVGWAISHWISRGAKKFSSKNLSFDAKTTHAYAWALLIISFLLRWLYARDYGGLISYLDHSVAIRSGLSDAPNRLSFLQPFGMMAIFSSFLFFASVLTGRRTFLKMTGFAASVVLSVYVLYSLMGRVGFLIYLFTFVLATLQAKRVRPSILVVGGVFGGVALLVCAHFISNWLGVKGASSLPEYVSKELSFPFASFFAHASSGDHLFRWYQDFLVAPLYFLPSSLWMHWVEDVSQINTLVVLGARRGDFGVTGGIPVDLLTLGYMQSSVAGVAVVGVLFGALIRGLQGFLDGISEPGLRSVLSAYVAIRVAAYAIAYAHPVHLINGTFGLLFSILLIASLTTIGRFRVGKSY